MTYTQDRETFIATVAAEGLPVSIIRVVLANANRLQKIAELSCSSEAADRDRVPCPGIKRETDCCCDSVGNHAICLRCDLEVEWNGEAWWDRGGCAGCPTGEPHDVKASHHSDIPRIDRQEARIKRQLVATMAKHQGFTLNFQGDPRGAVVKLAVPSGKYDDWGREGLCVPSKGLPASFWERNR